jgi:hypothetical protein
MNTSPLVLRLPAILPKAIAWAEGVSGQVLVHGQALVPRDIQLAQRIGVAQPERVRIAVVPNMPWPQDEELRAAGEETGLFSPAITGLTLGHGILLIEGRFDRRMIAHELRHVYQYERAGSIAAFLPLYLYEVATLTYTNAPFEIDARNHELLADATGYSA